METRQKQNVYLVESYEPEIKGAKLPSCRQALAHFLHLHKAEKKTIRISSQEAIQSIIRFWKKAGIPIRQSQHCIRKLEDLFFQWKALQKHKNRPTLGHKKKEEEFVDHLDDLFDIAHADALQIMKIPEDKEFLLNQRKKGRPGSIGSLDKAQTLRNKRAQERQEAQEKRQKKYHLASKADESKAQLTDSDSDTESMGESDETDKEFCVAASCSSADSKIKRGRSNIMTAGLAAALDRTKVSSRQAVFILSEMAQSLGSDVKDLNINRNSIERGRKKLRAAKSEKLHEQFSEAGRVLTVHWDGKLIPNLTSKEKVDRLPVLISGLGVEQLLGVPKLESGTGMAQAEAVIECLEHWGVKEQVAAACFDTTASNTGHRLGTCYLLEQKLEKDLLFTACRHHVMELILGAVFETALKGSSGPEILLFKRFQEKWDGLNKANFTTASADPLVESLVASSRDEIIEFAQTHLKLVQPRDDYKELLLLSIIFLGAIPASEVTFMAPGAMHRARWMAKMIYAIKIWLFREQFKLTNNELQGIQRIAVFSVLVYLKVWITAPIAIEAPLNDFLLMRKLLNYPDKPISDVASKKLGLHLWYLSEELVGLSLFDKRIPPESKKLMVAAMENESPDHPSKRPRIALAAFKTDVGLEQFFSTNTTSLFHLLRLPNEFLNLEPSEWENSDSYNEALKVLKGLAVVNDRAERGVALIQEYNKKLTKDEEQLQFLLQVVSDHRKKFPDAKKSTFMKNKD